ncbi:hypothetical protein F4827_003128 [Paraburkholderia bannensis]|uniref:Uncharacterized protein n=1 Tax=Paraburkholderia bannensis TaxID=765414 RepID=A0A7W9WTY8_9BURK|nr:MULTISPECIES: hypothetical protein [Paraburkholderia]MBB3258260.1 hypothetical protein [Paraburkholderia sp. WP4_3_2]MBB6103273.1 hypothetical protein [Paraburkholderia bannensis]
MPPLEEPAVRGDHHRGPLSEADIQDLASFKKTLNDGLSATSGPAALHEAHLTRS